MFLHQHPRLLTEHWGLTWALSTLLLIARVKPLVVRRLRRHANAIMPFVNACKSAGPSLPNGISRNSPAKNAASEQTRTIASPNGLFRKPAKTIKRLH